MIEYTCPIDPDVVLFTDASAGRAKVSSTLVPKTRVPARAASATAVAATKLASTPALRSTTGVELQRQLNSEAKQLRQEIGKIRRRGTLRLPASTRVRVQQFVRPLRAQGVSYNRIGRAVTLSVSTVRRLSHIDLAETPRRCEKCGISYYKAECNPRNR